MNGRVESPGETSRRRTTIVFLLDGMDTPVTVDQLVDELERHADRRPDSPGSDASWEDVHERLHEQDLPALDRAGLLTFRENQGVVARHGDRGSSRRPGTTRRVDDWSDPTEDAGTDSGAVGYFLALAVGSVVVLAATGLEVGPFARLPVGTVSTVIVAVFVAVSVLTAAREFG